MADEVQSILPESQTQTKETVVLGSELLGEGRFLKNEGAQAADKSVGNGHDQQEQIGVRRGKDMRSVPLPAIALEVTERGFLPGALGILAGGG